MPQDRTLELPEQSRQCLACACENDENLAAAELLRRTGSNGPVGVLASVFVAGQAEHDEIVALMREAILEQRAWCVKHGILNSSDCPLRRES